MMDHKEASAGSDHRIWAPLLAVAALAVAVVGYAYYHAEAERIRQEKYHEIAAVAELKAGQIAEWRRELVLDAEKMAHSPLLGGAVAQYLASPQEAGRGDILRERLRTEQIKDLDDALLLDPQGRILLAAQDDPDPLDPTVQNAVWAALAGGTAHLSDLYRCPHGVVHLDVVAPILDAAGEPIALVVLRSDAEHILYPLIQSWPTPSRSAETLLVRREGQEVLFLNELRHRAGAALSLRQPLADSDLPATQAILGKRGMFQGVDYRGVEVLADLRAIPDSPWFMVAKVDASEILAETNYRARVTALFVGMGVLMAAIAAAYASRRRQAGLYRSLYQAERQEREAEGRFRATLYSIGDGVITTDRAGRVQHMNPVAERLTGWAEAEARGQPLEAVFRIANEETHAPVENAVQRVLREGVIVGLANHTLLLARDGAERPIADSGAPIRDPNGEIIGVALVFRDQTAERAVRRALRQWADAFAHCGHGITLSDPATNCIAACNPAFARLHRRAVGEIIGVPIASLYAPEERARVEQRNAEADRTGRAQYDAWMIRQDGSTFPAQVDLVSVRDDDGIVLYRVATVEDITERRRAEQELRASEEKFSVAFRSAPHAIAITRASDGKVVEVNDRFLALSGYTPEEVAGKANTELNLWVNEADRAWALSELASGRSVRGLEISFRKKSGEIMVGLFSAETIMLRGEPCVLSNIADITDRKRIEIERDRLAQQRQLALDAARMGWWHYDPATDLSTWDERYKEIFGVPDDHKPNHEILNRLHPDDLPRVWAAVEAALDPAHPQPYDAEYRINLPDGSMRWIDAHGAAMFEGEGASRRATGLVGTVRDITAMKKVEADLRESEARHRTLFETMAQGVVYQNADGQIALANPAAERILGLSLDQMQGRTSIDPRWRAIHEDGSDFPGETHPGMLALRSGQPQNAVMGVYNPQDDAYRWIVIHAIPQFRPGEAQPHQVYTTFEDITAPKLAEERLRRNEELLRLFVEHAPAAIAMFDREMRYMAASRRFLRNYNLGEQDIIGRSHYEVFPEIPERWKEIHRRCLAGAVERAEDDPFPRADGHIDWVRWEIRPWYEPGGEIGGILLFSEVVTERKRAEEELRESEARFSTVFHASPMAIAITRFEDGRFIDVSGAWQAMTGYSRQEVIGHTPIEMNLWVDPAARDYLVQALREQGSVQGYDFQLRRRSGEVVDALMFAELIQVGGETCMLSMALDITARKRAEEARRESEARFSTVFRSSPMSIAIVQLSDHRILDVNPAWEQMTGYTREEAIGNTTTALNLWVDPTRRDHLIQMLGQEQGVYGYEAQARHKSGDIADVLLSTELITIGDQKCMLSMAVDITARKRAEESLARERALLRTVIDNLPDAIYAKDAEARKTLANRKDWAERGVESEAQVLGKTDLELYPPDIAARLMADDFAVLRTGQPIINREERLETAQGDAVWLLTSKLPLKDAEGRVIGLVGIGREITERVRAEEERQKLQAQLIQAQKMEAVGRLAGGVAHDFNNMLGVINGYAEMALEDLDPADPLYADMTEIASAGRRSANLTRQLLAFARQQTIAPVALDLNEAVGGMLKMLQRLIGEDIDLVWRPTTPLWPVLMDPAQLDQILANLAVNARDAIAGVGKLTIETAQVEFDEAYCREHLYTTPGQYVLLAVSDNGCGMDKETMTRIFEPFFTTKPQGQGTGLGLATVYGIVKQNNGFINVYSELGRGSTFRVYLPRYQAEVVAAAEQAHPQAATGAETVLLVEDDPALLKSSARMVEMLGYTVLEASGPAEALRLAREYVGAIHLLMTDVVMPGMSGRDLHQEISALRPEIKCLYMSGYTANVIAHHGVLDAGIHFLPKPFTKSILAAKLREALG